ncbi:hypothetical protein ACF1DY_28670 [Streptomyces albus]
MIREAGAPGARGSGRAYSLDDVREFLRRVRLDPDEADLHEQKLIEWRGGGPDVWRQGDGA